jgi:hypothetical protein
MDAEDPTPEIEEDWIQLNEDSLRAAAGWNALTGVSYEFPEISVPRGGISFSNPRLTLTKKELRARLDKVEPALAEARRLQRKAERKVRRLLKIIEREAGR